MIAKRSGYAFPSDTKVDRFQERILGKRLLQHGCSTEASGRLSKINVAGAASARHRNHGDGSELLTNRQQSFNAFHLGHDDIRQDQIEGARLERFDSDTSKGADARDALPTKTLPKVATEMALSVLAYKLTRVMNIVGVKPLIAAIGA
jgi:hypothetical protein